MVRSRQVAGAAGQAPGDGGGRGRPGWTAALAPADTDWLCNTLGVSGAIEAVGRFQTTAKGEWDHPLAA
ncbi:MAG: hypothetical protein EOP02_21950 [Proteobacteria bacterium]|nr:MAG: hypothetical protein EOP02_21950 [Pseudomonadota bacterium]